MSSQDNETWDVVLSLELFKKCLQKDGSTIDLKEFVIAYRSIVRFLDHLGKIFSFVKADLVDKFQNIEKLQQNDKDNNYQTIQSSLNFEKRSKDVYMVNHNATLSILRMHRGLDFIYNFLECLYRNKDNNKKTPELASQAYEKTLAFRHKWAVRKLCKTGFYMLPYKQDLIKILSQGIEKEQDKDRLFVEFLETINNIFKIIHELYVDNNFLELVVQ